MQDSDYSLSVEQVTFYRENGFVQLNDVVSAQDLRRFKRAVEAAVQSELTPVQDTAAKSSYEQIFIQKVNLWRRHPELQEFVLSKRFGNIAARLCGQPVRLWHDQALFKEARTGAKTPWHQDVHYWPHSEKGRQLSIWIALQDVTVTNGCMSFIPGSQRYDKVDPVNLASPQELYSVAPQLRGIKPVTCQLKAGSCTFHNGLTFHYAGPNRSAAMREAMVMIYMPDGTTYTERNHVVIDQGEFREGDPIVGPKFPLVSDVALEEIPVLEDRRQMAVA